MLASDQNLNEGSLSPTLQRALAMRDSVLMKWEKQVRNLVQGAHRIHQPILINTMPIFFDNLAEALSPEEITFPVSWYCALFNTGRPITNRHRVKYAAARLSFGGGRLPASHHSPASQVSYQFSF